MARLQRVVVPALGLALLATVAGVTAEETALPAGVRGFSGRVRGVVVSRGDKNTFFFKVARVLKVWEGNKATAPETLAGHTVHVGPRWEKTDGGRWRPVERHITFIKGLSTNQEMNLEIRNAERDHFAILELSEEQRAGAQAGQGTGESSATPSTEGKSDARVRELEKQVAELRAEMAALQRLLKAKD